MQLKQAVSAVFGMMFRLLITIIMVMLVYQMATFSYSFGYLVFADIPKELSPGYTKTVSISEGTSDWALAQTLQEQGIVSDAKVFYVQLILSEYKDDWKPGIYDLNTSMKSGEIITTIAGISGEEEKNSDS